jgi:hypothetical protein
MKKPKREYMSHIQLRPWEGGLIWMYQTIRSSDGDVKVIAAVLTASEARDILKAATEVAEDHRREGWAVTELVEGRELIAR